MTSLEQAQGLLAYLRFLAWEHQTSHWTCLGPNFFSDHGLFQRLYTETVALVDPLAERMVGQWGSVAVDPRTNTQVVQTLTNSAAGLDITVDRAAGKALAFTRGAMEVYADFRESLEIENLLTPGWEDLLDAQRHVFETHEYLLQQRVGLQVAQQEMETAWFSETPATEYAKVASEIEPAEPLFHDNPDHRSVRELVESKARSNLPESGLDKPSAPPTPEEIVAETPGSYQLSTLSRFLIQTEQPSKEDLPESRDDLPKHPVLEDWSFMEGA